MQSSFTEHDREAPDATNVLIQVEHLSRSITIHAKKIVILDDVTFQVPAQSLFAINGPSGSGKSTILKRSY